MRGTEGLWTQDRTGQDRTLLIYSKTPTSTLTQHGGDLGEGLFGLAGDERVCVGAEVPLSTIKVNGHLGLALGGRVRHDLQRLPSGHQCHLFTPLVGPKVESLSNIPDILFMTFVF